MTVFFQTIVNGLTTGAIYALVALGYTMVYGILKLLNFAHGDVYMVGAYIGYVVLQLFGGPTALSIPVPLLLLVMFVAAATVIARGRRGLSSRAPRPCIASWPPGLTQTNTSNGT